MSISEGLQNPQRSDQHRDCGCEHHDKRKLLDRIVVVQIYVITISDAHISCFFLEQTDDLSGRVDESPLKQSADRRLHVVG